MSLQSFTATLQRPEGVGTWTYLTVPFDAAAVYGVKGQIKVKGTLNGLPFRGSLMPHGNGRHFLVVKKALRDEVGVSQGSVVQVRLDRDTAARAVSVPRDFKQALAANPSAAAAFQTLPPSHQQEYLDYIAAAKKDETRQRRIAASIVKLAAD
jgi:hypothetical protein